RGPVHRRDAEDVDAEVRQEGAARASGADRGGGVVGGAARLIELDPEAVAALRLRRHALAPRLADGGAGAAVAAAEAACGIHAQVMSTTELQVWARCSAPVQGAVACALWEDRSLVRTWAMRGTLHLLTREQLALCTAAFDPAAAYGGAWFRAFEIT